MITGRRRSTRPPPPPPLLPTRRPFNSAAPSSGTLFSFYSNAVVVVVVYLFGSSLSRRVCPSELALRSNLSPSISLGQPPPPFNSASLIHYATGALIVVAAVVASATEAAPLLTQCTTAPCTQGSPKSTTNLHRPRESIGANCHRRRRCRLLLPRRPRRRRRRLADLRPSVWLDFQSQYNRRSHRLVAPISACDDNDSARGERGQGQQT